MLKLVKKTKGVSSDWSVCSCHTHTQGLQWCPLSEDEVIPRFRAMEGRRGRPPNAERQHGAGNSEGSGSRRRKGRPPNVGHTEFPSPSEAKLLRKLEAQGNSHTKPHPPSTYSQSETFSAVAEPSSTFLSCRVSEIARQAAQMKLMRKLEKQALARAAKEARKQQGTQIPRGRKYRHP